MPIYAPPSIRNFEPRHAVVSAWIDHVCFGYDLVWALRPGLVVELGTNRGMSYFTFCQSMKDHTVDGLCYGIDPWASDQHVGKTDESVFKSVHDHNREHYRGFSYLMRMRFDEAIGLFSDESIDLLHIDGTHTEEAVRQDFADWFPKLKPGGVVLLHDTEVRDNDFGVWKLWGEIASQYPSFGFVHGFGLGVLRKPSGPNTPATNQLLDVLFSGTAEDHQSLRRYYEHISNFQAMKRKVTSVELALRKNKCA